jgi:DNA-binding NarL/FixJ family response regulator
VVDDVAPWRQRVRSIIEAQPGLRVVGEASDGLAALQKAEELKPDLILLDISLPKLNGLEAEHRLCELVPSAKLLFLTQNNDPDIVQAALSNGAQGYVLKTDAGSELLTAIEAVLHGEKFVSSGIKQNDFPTT